MGILRHRSYYDKSLCEALARKCTEWETLLQENCVVPTNVYYWIKQSGNVLYPKIDIDLCGQEIQFEMFFGQHADGSVDTNVLYIGETHFKTFKHENSKCFRVDVWKGQANIVVQAIDFLIKQYEAASMIGENVPLTFDGECQKQAAEEDKK